MHTKKRTTNVDNVGEGPLRDVDVFAMNKVTNRKEDLLFQWGMVKNGY